MIKEGRSISVTTAEFHTYSKAEIDAKVNEARQLQLNEFIKYGDRVLISQNPEKCLHSGLFAGFGGCNVREAEVAGFQLEFHLNNLSLDRLLSHRGSVFFGVASNASRNRHVVMQLSALS